MLHLREQSGSRIDHRYLIRPATPRHYIAGYSDSCFRAPRRLGMSDQFPTRFDPLPAALQTHLQHQRSLIAARVAASFPTLPVQWPLAPSTLQRVVDAELIDRADCDGWEALGVAFGDTLAQRVPGLTWMQVTDAWGIDAVLRYADSSLQIGASTLLLKRVEQGEIIDIAHLLAWLEEFVATRADDYA